MAVCVDKHRAFIYDRGGIKRLDEITGLRSVKYDRRRDDTSEGTITIGLDECKSQMDKLERIAPGRHEIVIFRGEDRVWEGPIQIADHRDFGFEIDAADVSWYWKKTVVHAAYSNAYPNIAYTIDRAKTIITAELARKEALGYNLLPYFTYVQTTGDAKTSRVTKAYEKTLFQEIDELAEKSGMDYTVVGRRVILWDTDNNIGQTPVLTEADFLGDGIRVAEYGSQVVTRAISTDGQGNAGIAGVQNAGQPDGVDPFYGELEDLQSPTQEDQDSGTSPTAAELQSQAQANLTGKVPAPVIISVGEDASLNPNGVLQMGDLVPGVYVPIQAVIRGRYVDQWQKFDKITVTEDEKGEKITASFSPAPQGAIII